MITLEADFTTKTFAGHTRCTAEKNVFSNYRDIEKAGDAIKWVSKVLRTGGNPMVSFTHFNGHTVSISRLFTDFTDGKWGFTEIHWDDKGNVISKEFHEKLTVKDIRRLYLECADKAVTADEKEAEEKASA